MSQPLPIPPPGFDELSIDEQIEYVQALWEHIVLGPKEVPIPDWHLEILKERMERYGDSTEWTTWEEFKKELDEEQNQD